MYIFVYGTLKMGYGANGILSRHHAQFVGEAQVKGCTLIGGCIPVMRRCKKGVVKGELFYVPTQFANAVIRSLDNYEGRGYYRRPVSVRLDDCEYRAMAYMGHGPDLIAAEDSEWH